MRLLTRLKQIFRKEDTISIGEMGEDRFAPLLRNGKETNCRIYLWDPEVVRKLQEASELIHIENKAKKKATTRNS